MYIWSWKKQKNCTFYTKNEDFAQQFHQNLQILDKNWSFVPKNVHLVLKKQKKIVLFTINMTFLPKDFTKMYKFWIKTVVLYPKMYIWSWKNKKFVLFTLKMKFLPKNFTKINVQILDKNCSFVPKNVHFVIKKQKKLYFLH